MTTTIPIPPTGPSWPTLQEQYPQFEIGEWSYGDLSILDWSDGTKVTIGAYSSFGYKSTVLLGGNHRPDWVTTFPFSSTALRGHWPSARAMRGHPASNGDIYIGSDVWVGADALILSGVTIGDGAVIAARSCVERDVPAYAHAIGFPARVLKYRFDERTIERLLAIKWWNWPRARIERALPTMLQSDIEAFLAAVEQGEL